MYEEIEGIETGGVKEFLNRQLFMVTN